MDEKALHRNEVTRETEGCVYEDLTKLLQVQIKKAIQGAGDSSVEQSPGISTRSLKEIAPKAMNKRRKGQPLEVVVEKDFDRNTKINETFVENIDKRNLFY